MMPEVYEYSGGPWPTLDMAMSSFRSASDDWFLAATAPEFFRANGAWYWYAKGNRR